MFETISKSVLWDCVFSMVSIRCMSHTSACNVRCTCQSVHGVQSGDLKKR